MNIVNGLRYRLIENCGYVRLIHLNSIRSHNISKEGDASLVESIFIRVDIKVILLQLFENSVNVFGIFIGYQEVNKDIIYISDTELIKVFIKN